MYRPAIAIVTATTRLQGLLARWGTKGSARFRLNQAVLHEAIQSTPATSKRSGRTQAPDATALSSLSAQPRGDTFAEYEDEDQIYKIAVDQVHREVDLGFPITVVPRQHIANFDFNNVVVVIVIGQDGLVANVAKYAVGLPIIGINPDPRRIDGILVPFRVDQARTQLQRVFKETATVRQVTLARASLNDGQSMLAFNDLFIGRRSHASARYTLQASQLASQAAESQSSSGVIVATGAGSTGWLSSVFNMTNGVNQWIGNQSATSPSLKWEDRRLAWVVREPFKSKHSGTNQVAGMISEREHLTLSSLMPEAGVVFSDGIESDFLDFNSGTILKIEVASEVARLVVP